MYKTHKNIINVQLDLLEALVFRIGDEKNRSLALERVKLYREQFENIYTSGGSVVELENSIRHFTISVTLFLSGASADLSTEEKTLPIINFPDEDQGAKASASGFKRISDLISSAAHKIDSVSDRKQKSAALLSLEELYMHIPKLNQQNIEQFLSKIKYDLMIAFLLNNETNKAKILMNSFNADMRLFIIKRLSALKETLKSQKRFEEALGIIEYIDSDKADITTQNAPEKQLEFWEKIIRIERPELDYHLPEVVIKPVNSDKRNVGLSRSIKSFKKCFF